MNNNKNLKRAISLFSGAGGDTLGMEEADVDVCGFIEYDEDAIKTHLMNFPNSKLIGTDIRKIPLDKFDKYKDNIDFIFGGFPCQSFSNCGKKNSDDKRGFLYKEFVRIVEYIKPKIILGENVIGILTRKNKDGKLIFNIIMRDFERIGYKMIYKKIRCDNFGIAQIRKRVFIIGIRDDLNIDVKDINLPDGNGKSTILRDICKFSLHNALKIEKDKFINLIPINKFIESSDKIKTVTGKPPTNLLKCYNEIKNHGISFKTRNKSTYSGIEDIDSGAHTILCAYNRMPRLFIPMKIDNNVYLRPFTIGELKQIQGFPIDFKFFGNENSIIKQIGNAIPAIVVTEIIKYLKGFL